MEMKSMGRKIQFLEIKLLWVTLLFYSLDLRVARQLLQYLHNLCKDAILLHSTFFVLVNVHRATGYICLWSLVSQVAMHTFVFRFQSKQWISDAIGS